MDFFRQIQQLKLPALSRNAGKGTHQLTDSGTVDVADVAEIQQDTFSSFGKLPPNGLPQVLAFLSDRDLPAESNYRYGIHFFRGAIDAHVQLLLFLAGKGKEVSWS